MSLEDIVRVCIARMKEVAKTGVDATSGMHNAITTGIAAYRSDRYVRLERSIKIITFALTNPPHGSGYLQACDALTQ